MIQVSSGTDAPLKQHATSFKVGIEGFDEVVQLLLSTGNRDFRNYKEATLMRRTRRRMCLHHMETIGEYLAFLKRNPIEVEALASDLLISVTDFFRDPDAWEALSHSVIPEIVNSKSHQEVVRVWVAGCATGEEAYTIAMLVSEEISKQFKTCGVQVFASDVDKRALNEARSGRYPISIVADVSAERLAKFFSLKDGDLHYQVNKSLRDTVVFAEQNLLSDPPFSQLDLVLCRNVMIYLKPEMQEKLIGLFHFALRRRGYLMLGTAETVGRQGELFQSINQRWRIYQGIGPTRHDRLDLPLTSGIVKRVGEIERIPKIRREQRVAHVAQQMLVEMIAPRAILIDSNWRILYISGDVNQYILHKPGVPSDDLFNKVREGLRSKLRGAVHEAFEKKCSVRFECHLTTNSDTHDVRVEVRHMADGQHGEAFILIVFFDESDNARNVTPGDDSIRLVSQASGQAEPELDMDDKRIIELLEEELSATKADLQSTIEQCEASNEEFKASNEEVMSVNEELQSTNEELETSKEELQSLYEELSTVNMQLGSKVEELEIKHADLENLISATDVATVCLGADLRIRWFTSATKQLIRIQASDIDRPLPHLQHDFPDDSLLDDCKKVLKHLVAVDSEVDCADGRSLIRRIVPYRSETNRNGGVVITMVDITSRRRRERELQASEKKLRELAKSLESQVQERTVLLDILQHVTRFANEASSIEEAMQSSLAKITSYNGWRVGHVWRRTDVASGGQPQLESSGFWHINPPLQWSESTALSSPHTTDSDGGALRAVPATAPLRAFQALTAKMRISAGEGLVGLVMETGKPQWMNDIHKHSDLFLRLIPGLNLHAALAFPITIAGDVVAVMEFFADQEIAPHEQFLNIVPDIGIQLGHVISRRRLQTVVANIAEAEQQRIGRQLHDGIAQQLTGGALIAQSLKQSLPKDMISQIESLNHLVDLLNQAHQDVRTLSSGLLPEPINAADLLPTLRGFAAETAERFQIPCELDASEVDESLLTDDGIANLVLLVARESIHNAVKHAEANRIQVKLSMDGTFRLLVSDDGHGFEPGQHVADSNGLRIMRFRAESVGGDLRIESSPHRGTKVVLTIPRGIC